MKTYQHLIDCLHQQPCQSSCQKHTTVINTTLLIISRKHLWHAFSWLNVNRRWLMKHSLMLVNGPPGYSVSLGQRILCTEGLLPTTFI